jgi:two-component system, cell cycle response regulator
VPAKEDDGEMERPYLIVLQGPGLGDFFALDEETLVVGSDPFRADIVVRDVEVEPRHARIRLGSDAYVIGVLQTCKGTLVNGESLEGEHALSNGDRISMGDSVLEFSSGDPVKARFHDALHRLISRDYLTGLLVKNRFDEEFEHLLDAQRSAGDRPLSILMADIDNLKKVNDAHGHLLGEYVVGEVGRIIGESHVGDGRQACRFGGDEYQTILPGCTKREALEIAEEIRRRVERHDFENKGISPTISIGVASFPDDGTTRAALTRCADEALYRAKRMGGNAVSD